MTAGLFIPNVSVVAHATDPARDDRPLVYNSGRLMPISFDLVWDRRLAAIDWAQVADPHPHLWTRVAFGNVTGEAVQQAAAVAVDQGFTLEGWRWLQRLTPIANLPFVLIEKRARCDVALMELLARRLDAYGAAIQVGEEGEACVWYWFDPAKAVRSAETHDAAEVIGLWHDLAITMGEGGDVIRWPNRERGHILGPP